MKPKLRNEVEKMLRPKIGLDWDDVTAPFNSLAIEMANEKYQYGTNGAFKLYSFTIFENP